MRDKYTNQELYNWMVGQIPASTSRAISWPMTWPSAPSALIATNWGSDDSSFIQFGYWDSLKKGLLAGERLHHDLKRMEVAYLEQNRREYEITKHVSLLSSTRSP